MAPGWIQGFIAVYTSEEGGCAEEGLWPIVNATTQDTNILYSDEALPLERLTKWGGGGQKIVLILKQLIKQSAGAGTAHTSAAHSPRVSGHCFPLTVQPATHHGAPSKAEVGNLPCQLTHYSRLPADYTFPLPENNSKQIRHSICLGQLPQTVKTSNKNTGWEVWPDEKSLPLLVHFHIHQKLFSQTVDMLNMRYLTAYIILPILFWISQCCCSDQGIFFFSCKIFIRYLLISKYLKLYLFDTLN